MRVISKKLLFATVAAACLACPALEANAAVVTYSFRGVWDSYSESGSLFPVQNIGDVFTGTFTYDDSTPDTNGSDGNGLYSPTGMITTSFGGGSFANTPTPNTQYIETTGSPLNASNPYWFLKSYNCESSHCGNSGGDSGGSFNGNPLQFLYGALYLQGDASADTGGAIDPLNLSLYLFSQFYLQAAVNYDPNIGYESVVTGNGHLTSLNRVSAVPLPGALPLFLAGLAGLGFLGRNARHRSARPA